MDWLDDLREWVKNNPIDYSDDELVGKPDCGELNAFYGLTHTEESKAQMRESAKRRHLTTFAEKQRVSNAKKTWLFISPDNKVVWFKGSLKYFCEQRGLNFGRMAQVHQMKPRCKSHKGWRGYVQPQ